LNGGWWGRTLWACSFAEGGSRGEGRERSTHLWTQCVLGGLVFPPHVHLIEFGLRIWCSQKRATIDDKNHATCCVIRLPATEMDGTRHRFKARKIDCLTLRVASPLSPFSLRKRAHASREAHHSTLQPQTRQRTKAHCPAKEPPSNRIRPLPPLPVIMRPSGVCTSLPPHSVSRLAPQ